MLPHVITMILLAFAFVCLLLAAIGATVPRVNLGWLGLAIWMLTILLGGK